MLHSSFLYNAFSKAASFLRSMYLERKTWVGILHPVSKTESKSSASSSSFIIETQLRKAPRPCRGGGPTCFSPGKEASTMHHLHRLSAQYECTSRSWLTSGSCIVLIFFPQRRLTKHHQLARRHAVQGVFRRIITNYRVCQQTRRSRSSTHM